jgi:hypothetical protein
MNTATIRAFIIRSGLDPLECTATGVIVWEWWRRWLEGHNGPVVGATYIKKGGAVMLEPLFRLPDLRRVLNAWVNRGDTGAQLQLGFAG